MNRLHRAWPCLSSQSPLPYPALIPPPCSSQVWPVTEIVTYGFDPADAPLDMRGEDGGGAWWEKSKGRVLKNREGMSRMTQCPMMDCPLPPPTQKPLPLLPPASLLPAAGTHLPPADFHAAMADPNSIMIDVRNFNESLIGKFAPPPPAEGVEKVREGGGVAPPPPLPRCMRGWPPAAAAPPLNFHHHPSPPPPRCWTLACAAPLSSPSGWMRTGTSSRGSRCAGGNRGGGAAEGREGCRRGGDKCVRGRSGSG